MEDCRGFFKRIFPVAHVCLAVRVALIIASFSAARCTPKRSVKLQDV